MKPFPREKNSRLSTNPPDGTETAIYRNSPLSFRNISPRAIPIHDRHRVVRLLLFRLCHYRLRRERHRPRLPRLARLSARLSPALAIVRRVAPSFLSDFRGIFCSRQRRGQTTFLLCQREERGRGKVLFNAAAHRSISPRQFREYRTQTTQRRSHRSGANERKSVSYYAMLS